MFQDSKRRFFLKNYGFTLLELLIVIFLTTLLIGIGSVFFANALPSNRINSTAREISALIRIANTSSRIEGQTKTLILDMDKGYYGLEKGRLKKVPDGVNIMVKDMLLGEIKRGRYTIVFQPFGSIPVSTIVLYNDKRSVNIEVDPVVGSIFIK
jgi:prepilin-type N-terminal cleavage/methylation domain-containing protein